MKYIKLFENFDKNKAMNFYFAEKVYNEYRVIRNSNGEFKFEATFCEAVFSYNVNYVKYGVENDIEKIFTILQNSDGSRMFGFTINFYFNVFGRDPRCLFSLDFQIIYQDGDYNMNNIEDIYNKYKNLECLFSDFWIEGNYISKAIFVDRESLDVFKEFLNDYLKKDVKTYLLPFLYQMGGDKSEYNEIIAMINNECGDHLVYSGEVDIKLSNPLSNEIIKKWLDN